ncbi:MAG: DUF3307 domain-containing protein [Clostridiaceae bacterium]|nr:DUF3307 domain-containing protein [Clostridiaceae bacterium]
MSICLMLIAHFLADFTLQPEKLAQKKQQKISYFMVHILIYALVFSFVFLLLGNSFIPWLIIMLSHLLVDLIRMLIDKKQSSNTSLLISFVLDQVIHISIIIFIYYAFNFDAAAAKLDFIIENRYLYNFIVYLLTFLILWDPAAIFINKLFDSIFNNEIHKSEHYQDISNREQVKNEPRVGRIIGKLERIIVSFFIFNAQFGTIGFVLTAKSIARYKQLEDKEFAEKYIVGTLTSVFISMIVTIILKQLLV